MHGTNAPEAYMTGRMLIGGELVESEDGAWLESINPADESALGRVPMGSAADMAAAVEAAEKARAAGCDAPLYFLRVGSRYAHRLMTPRP